MSLLDSVGSKTRRTMGFALVVAFLSSGAISGCSSSNNDSFDFADSGQPDGGLDVVDPDAGIYPNIQVIQPFLSGAIDPIKVQYWDQTYYWGPDSAGNDACFKGTVGILDSPNLAQETAPGPECPTPLGQVTPCNPAAAADTVASGAVQPAIAGCERGGAACTDILVPGITDEVTCESTVRMADPIAAGAAWFQNIDAPGTKGGTASHWWYGTRADKTFDAEDRYGGTQIDYISDVTNINIAASGGGSGPTTRVNNIYLCSNKDVVNPAESPDVCTLSSLFGSCDKGDLKECKINNIGLVDGAYNVFIRSATPSEGFGGGEPEIAAKPVMVGYLQESGQLTVLAAAQKGWDIIVVAFGKFTGDAFTISFSPSQGDAALTADVRAALAAGAQHVLLSTGGQATDNTYLPGKTSAKDGAKSMVAYVQQIGFTGIDFDIEITSADASYLTDLITEIGILDSSLLITGAPQLNMIGKCPGAGNRLILDPTVYAPAVANGLFHYLFVQQWNNLYPRVGASCIGETSTAFISQSFSELQAIIPAATLIVPAQPASAVAAAGSPPGSMSVYNNAGTDIYAQIAAEYQKINSPQFGGAMMWSINKDINDQFYTAVRPAIARGPGPQNCQTCCSFSTSGTYTGPLNPKAYTDLNCPGQIAAGRESNHIFDNTSPRGTTCDATAGLPPNLLLINRTYNLSCTKSWSSL